MPRSRCRSTSRSRILPRTETSSADTASSSTIRSGLVASARAIATRWRWPPEISWMARPASAGSRPTRSSSRAIAAGRSRAVGDAVDAQRIGERAGDRGARVEGGERILEHHLDAPAHGAQFRAPAAPAGRRRRNRSRPASGSTRRRRTRASVDLPLPEGRRGRASRPRATAIETSSSATTRRPPAREGLRDAGGVEKRRGHAAASAISGGVARSIWLAKQLPRVGVLSGAPAHAAVGPASTSRALRNTAMRSAKPDASAMSWVMKSERHAVLAHQFIEQRDDLGLHDRVERAGRLVGDQQLRPRRDCRGDRDALALAAGELVRIGARARRRAAGMRTRCSSARGAVVGVAPAEAEMALRHLGDLLADRQHRIEAGAGVLEDEADVAAGEAARGQAPASRCRPVDRALSGSSPASASASVLLPEPLSPMTASRSPATISRSTPSSAAVVPSVGAIGDRQRRRGAPARALMPAPSGVASASESPSREEIDAEHGDHQRDARDDRQEGRRAQHVAAFGDHRAPGDDVGVAEAEEGKRRLGEHRARDDDRAQRQHRRQRVGQHFAKAISSGCMPITRAAAT